MPLPERLFKFMPEPLFLDNGLFRFTQPSKLNDPYEAVPGLVVNDYSPEDIAAARARAAAHGMRMLPDDDLQAMFLQPFPSRRFDEKGFPGLWPATEGRLRAEPFQTIAEFDSALAERAVDLISKVADATMGVLSLTSAQTEALWAYYARDGAGVCVEFDPGHPFFERLQPMVYSDQPFSVSVNGGWLRIGGVPIRTEDVLDGKIGPVPEELFLRKRADWAQEKEWRLLRLLDGATKVVDAVHLFEVPANAVFEVTFGWRAADDAIVSAMTKIAADPRWHHLRVDHRHRKTTGLSSERLR